MSVKSKASSEKSLLAAIQRKGPQPSDAPVATPRGRKTATTKPESAGETLPQGRVGKPVQFWMHDEDRQIVRELAAWLAGQGIRPTDSMVIRATLRAAKTGGELLDAYRQAAQLDGRLKQHKVA
jgi:hypothetical protein